MGIGDSLPRRLFIVDDKLLDLFYSGPSQTLSCKGCSARPFYATPEPFIMPIKKANASRH